LGQSSVFAGAYEPVEGFRGILGLGLVVEAPPQPCRQFVDVDRLTLDGAGRLAVVDLEVDAE
jgi:hypothetical protein